MKKKKKLSPQQEFEIMKLVLDKFLWLGFVIMAFGLYKMVDSEIVSSGIWYIIIGAAILILFLILIVKEYEIVR